MLCWIVVCQLPKLPSVLHALYVVLIVQVWLKLPVSWRAAENRSANMPRPPPLSDPKLFKLAKHRSQLHAHCRQIDPPIDPCLSWKLLGEHWKDFVWKCQVVLVFPLLHAFCMCKHQLLTSLLASGSVSFQMSILPWIQVFYLLLSYQV
jgi:hypothetical protein